MIIYFIYAFGVVITVALSILLIKKKQNIAVMFSMFPTILSILLFWLFAEQNFFTEPCGGIDDCMNETGMLLVLSIYLIIISIGILLFAILINVFRGKNGNI